MLLPCLTRRRVEEGVFAVGRTAASPTGPGTQAETRPRPGLKKKDTGQRTSQIDYNSVVVFTVKTVPISLPRPAHIDRTLGAVDSQANLPQKVQSNEMDLKGPQAY